MEQKIRKLRRINDVLKYIKSYDEDSAVSRFMIERLIDNKEVYHVSFGKSILVDLDEVLERIGLQYD